MREFLLSISLLLWSVVARASGGPESFFPKDEAQRAEYAVTMDFGRMHLSGICVMKRIGGELVGTLMNEFGVRAFDFRYDPHRGTLKLSNLLALLDRWYIRKTLRRDLQLLLRYGDGGVPRTIRGRRLERRTDGPLVLTHLRRDLKIGFSPLNP